MVLLAATLAASLGAQERERKQRGPRALAVLETGGNEALPGTVNTGKQLTTGIGFPRLVPVTILENGEYHDATVYKATPVPLAVQSGIVYEVLQTGASEGLFVIQQPNQLHGSWVGTGKLQPPSPEKSKAEAPAATAQKSDEDEGPPRLRRSVEPPPVKTQPAPPARAAAPKPVPVQPKRVLPHLLVAISDATPYENRPYAYPWSPHWKAQYTKEMLALAQRALAAYGGCKPGKTSATSCALTLAGVDVHAFDLETNNDAEIVLSARAQRNGQYLYVTVVGRVGSLGQVEKVFTTVTDDAHLDTTGRLEFIDAVDADGDGRGELLFRRLHNASQTFELYRVGREQMWKLFDGAESSL